MKHLKNSPQSFPKVIDGKQEKPKINKYSTIAAAAVDEFGEPILLNDVNLNKIIWQHTYVLGQHVTNVPIEIINGTLTVRKDIGNENIYQKIVSTDFNGPTYIRKFIKGIWKKWVKQGNESESIGIMKKDIRVFGSAISELKLDYDLFHKDTIKQLAKTSEVLTETLSEVSEYRKLNNTIFDKSEQLTLQLLKLESNYDELRKEFDSLTYIQETRAVLLDRKISEHIDTFVEDLKRIEGYEIVNYKYIDAEYNLVVNDYIQCDTSKNDVTLILPESVENGDVIYVLDIGGKFDFRPAVLENNDHTIMDIKGSTILNKKNYEYKLLYTTKGWRVI